MATVRQHTMLCVATRKKGGVSFEDNSTRDDSTEKVLLFFLAERRTMMLNGKRLPKNVLVLDCLSVLASCRLKYVRLG